MDDSGIGLSGSVTARDHGTGWTLWVEELPRPGWENMAIDVALLDRADALNESWLRLYRWEPHCLSFGRHEPAARRYDRQRIAAMGLDTVRRPTGGRAVWHSRELTYAVATPWPWFGSLQNGYREIHRMLADALESLGLDVFLAPRERPVSLTAGACFAHAVGGEVLSHGHKLVGSAQLRRNGALLQHGSILITDEQHVVASCTREVAEGTIPLKPTDRPEAGAIPRVSVERLIDAIAGTSRSRWGGSWREITNSDEVLQSASRYGEQFQSPAWTWER